MVPIPLLVQCHFCETGELQSAGRQTRLQIAELGESFVLGPREIPNRHQDDGLTPTDEASHDAVEE